jgi:hypothetical protein
VPRETKPHLGDAPLLIQRVGELGRALAESALQACRRVGELLAYPRPLRREVLELLVVLALGLGEACAEV